MKTPSRIMKITIGVVGALVSIIVLVFVFRYFRNFKSISEFPRDSRKQFEVSHKLLPFSQPNKGMNFTHSFWIYIEDWNYKHMTEKNILEKGGLMVYLGGRNNNLYIEVPVLNSTRPERVVYENLPIQKWINVVILMENRHLDVWLNGKLYHSRYLENIPDFKPKQDAVYLSNGGFSGYISRIYHYDENISKKRIRNLFLSGPINTNPIFKLYLLLRNLFTKAKRKKPQCKINID